jgi:hypothetical protein
MRTVTYDYVLQRACELTGRVFSTLTTEESNFFRTFISMSLRSAWECFDWPEQTVYQQEFFAPTYSYQNTYNAGDVVYFPVEEKYYQWVNITPGAGQSPTTSGPNGTLNSIYWSEAQPSYGNNDGDWDSTTSYTIGQIVLYPVTQEHYQLYAIAPSGTVPTNTAYWGILNKFLRNISQTNNPDGTTRAVPIGETFSVWPADPRVTWRQQEVTYTFTDDGVLVGNDLPYVWLEFRKTPPLLSNSAEATAYAFPYRFCEICALKAAGQMLRVDGKIDLGNQFLELGEVELTKEIDKVALQEKYVRQIIVPSR